MKRLLLSLLTTALLGGCVVLPGHLYPVAGPLSTQTPLPIFDITLSQPGSQAIVATLQNGEVCQGVRIQILQNDPSATQMSAQWDLVYGQGFFVANVLGSKSLYRADLTGKSGTRLRGEFDLHTTPQTSSAKGIAQDNHGNVYKVTSGVPSPSAAAVAPAK